MPPQLCSEASLHAIFFLTFFTFQCCRVTSAAIQTYNNSGALHDTNSSVSREEKIAMRQMVIGLPVKRSFDEFVKCADGETPTGYCIDVFNEAIKNLGQKMPPYRLECFNGTYDELVDQVFLKKYDAAVGDITIMANRSHYVDFTQPYMESLLTMIAPVTVDKHTWLFVKPFTAKTWLLIFGGFVYTMFVVWVLEHRSNPDFKGPWVSQLSTSLWFTFSTLFFAHRESVRSNYTRAVLFVWFCAVFVVVSSYQGSLTSILTLQNLRPTVTDVQQLKNINATVGCDGNAFYRKYVEETLGFHPNNIINIISNEDYIYLLKNGTISAAFLEVPYARILLSKDRKDYKDSGGQKDRFGGFGFVFPLESQLARDFSRAFLALSEDGSLKKFDEKWFPPNLVDSSSESNIEDQRLDHNNFTGLFLMTGTTSTVILVFYFILGLRRHSPIDHVSTEQLRVASDESNLSPSRNFNRSMSLDAESLNEFYTPGREILMQETYAEVPDNQTTPLRHAMGLPGPDRHASGANSVVPP